MSLSLYEAIAPTFLQILGSTRGILDKAEAWCEEQSLDPSDVIAARLREDMLPFSYQVKSCWSHSALSMECVQKGAFQPDMSPPPDSFDGLRDRLDTASDFIMAYDKASLDSIAANPMVFTIKDRFRLDFTVQNFLLGFSLPNFHFHAATAYGICRMKGVDIGKGDYLGAMPVLVTQ